MSGHQPTIRSAVWVALGGAVGAVMRWALGELAPDTSGFPWTTFAINVSGALALGLLPALGVVRRHPVAPLFLGTGVLGGFTTFSTYAEQARMLIDDGAYGTALAYLAGTLGAALLAVNLARHLTTRGERAIFAAEEGDR